MYAFLEGKAWLKEHACEIKVPVLLVHCYADVLNNWKDSVTFYEMLTTEDKQVKIYQGGQHEVYSSDVKDEVLADVGSWLKFRL